MKKVLVGVLAVLLIILVGIGGYIYKIIGALSDMDNSPIIWDENPGDFGIPEGAP